jgi:hypothetical protein
MRILHLKRASYPLVPWSHHSAPSSMKGPNFVPVSGSRDCLRRKSTLSELDFCRVSDWFAPWGASYTFVVEQAKTKAVEVALADLDIGNTNSRARSTSQSSKLSEACSSASYSSVSSQDSHHSNIATPISTMGDETLPPSLPRISYEDWSKFGINLFAPKLLNPHSKIYYHYPNVEKKKTHVNHLTGNRSRLRSSTVHGYSHPQDKGNHNFNTPVNPQSPNLPAQNRPHPQSPLTRFCSLRHPLERNYTR